MTFRSAKHVGSILAGLSVLAVVAQSGPPAASGGKAITVGAAACSNGHRVNAEDCALYTQGGKVTVCHFEDHAGDFAVASPAACGSDD